LIDYTVQEFLEKEHGSLFPSAHCRIAEICCLYLSIVVPNAPAGPAPTRYKFSDYALDHWAIHAQIAYIEHPDDCSELTNLAVTLLSSESKASYLGEDLDRHRLEDCIHNEMWHCSGLQVAAHFVLEEIIHPLILSGADVNAVDSHDVTVLATAVGFYSLDGRLILKNRAEDNDRFVH
jgi:hypothetical protein